MTVKIEVIMVLGIVRNADATIVFSEELHVHLLLALI